MRLRWASILFVLFVALGSDPSRGEEMTSLGKKVPKELEGLSAVWAKQLKELGTPGMAVVVVKEGEVVFLEVFGTRDPETGAPVTPDTGFYIASMTKSYLALAMKQAEERGALSLNDPVKKYLPRLDLPDDGVEQRVRVRDLLSHRYGIDSEATVFLDAYTGQITEDRYYHFLAEGEVAGKQVYTNPNYTLAGRVLEAATGSSWKDVLAETLFRPAGMDDTTAYASELYGRDDAAQPSEVKGGVARRAPVRKSNATMHAAGGMGTTIRDLGQWLKLHTSDGVVDGERLLSSAGMKDVHRTQATGFSMEVTPGYTRDGYTLGWFVGTYRGEPLLEHGGGYIGTSSKASFLPKRQVGVGVLINKESRYGDLVTGAIYDRYLGLEPRDIFPLYKRVLTERNERLARENPDDLPDAAAAGALDKPPAAYAGTYEDQWWGMIELRAEGEKLVGSYGDLPVRFVAMGSGSLKVDLGTEQLSSCRFIEDEDGKVTGLRLQLAAAPKPVLFERTK